MARAENHLKNNFTYGENSCPPITLNW